MAKKVNKKWKKNKATKFFNKKCQDLTVKETLIYGAVASVAAVVVSIVPFAVLGYIENKEPKVAETPMFHFPTSAEEATEEVEETEEF